MPALGNLLLLAAFVTCAYAIAASVAGARRRSTRLIESGTGAFYLITALMTVASGVMVHAFVTNNYTIKYVQRYSEAAQPLAYKIASYWGGLDGSVMFWVFLLSIFGSIAVYTNRERHRELIPYVVAVIATTQMFFLLLMVVHNNPFSTYLTPPPQDGQGLSPLLQNFYMAIHPPSLYTGLVAMTIPYAFGMAALITGHLDDCVAAGGAPLDDDRLAGAVVRPDARDAVGLRRARLGRLLGLGSGRERRPAALVHRHRLPALGDGAGAARDAAGVERHAGHHHVLPDDLRDVHDPIGRRAVGPRVRRGSRAGAAVHDLHGPDRHLQLRPGDSPPAAAALAQRARLLGLARGGVPGEQLDPAVHRVLRAVRHDVPDAERGGDRRASDRRSAVLQQVDAADRPGPARADRRRAAAGVAQVDGLEPGRSVPVSGGVRVRRRRRAGRAGRPGVELGHLLRAVRVRVRHHRPGVHPRRGGSPRGDRLWIA